MKRVIVIGLVVIVVMTGLPVLMGMGNMAFCSECEPGILWLAPCLAAMLIAAAVLPTLLWARVRSRPRSLRVWLLVRLLERPPRLV